MSSEHQNWRCPICTLNNSYLNKKCTACLYTFDTKTKKHLIKTALNSLSNDVKGLLNSLNNNRREINNNNHDSSPDVIEIGAFSPNKRHANSATLSPSIDQLWSCKSCSYSTNPSWSNECDICSTKRDLVENKAKADSNGLTLYDASLNEKIYDFARIWPCKMCTYVNFSKDLKCELCSTPRNESESSSSSTSTSSNLSSKTTSTSSTASVNLNPGWVCKQCTYFNSEKDAKCVVCFNKCPRLDRSRESSSSKSDLTNEWICETCSHRNYSNSSICILCSNDRDNDEVKIDVDDDEANIVRENGRNTSVSSGLDTSFSRSQRAKSTAKCYINAHTEAERIWRNIISYCKSKGHKFVDDAFPPCDKSLYINANSKQTELKIAEKIEWLCPEYIRTPTDDRHLPWTVFNNPSPSDITQGLIGNCWFLSALAVLVEQPGLLEKIIINTEYCAQGCYQVRLCHNGEWKTVILDDLFPCYSNGSLIFSQASRKQLWVPLIEKALAKLNGSYESLIAGQTVEGLSALTGYPCESIRLEASSNRDEEIDFDLIWVRLLSMKEAGYIMGASCGRNDISDDRVFSNLGLASRHAYSLLDVQEINGNRLVQLRNPWGRGKWQGDWSESSQKWTQELRSQLKLKQLTRKHKKQSSSTNDLTSNKRSNTKSDRAIFWISFDDLKNYFCSIDVCKTRLDLFESRITGFFSPEGTRETQAYQLAVFETSEIDISLFHKTAKNRRENSEADLAFIVLKSNGSKDSAGGSDLLFSSKRTIKKFITKDHIFEPGQYLIVPISFNFWYTFNHNNFYNLVVHSSKTFYLEQETHSHFLQADALIKLSMRNGTRTTNHIEHGCIYTLSKQWSGLIVVAENSNQHMYLHVELDCERSANVVSTRQGLTTRDSVPPLHRQVLMVLTHLEASSGFSIQFNIKYRNSSNPYLNSFPGGDGLKCTNQPEINKQTLGLHAPRSLFV